MARPRKAKTISVRISEEHARKAGIVAAIRKISVPDYLDQVMEAALLNDYPTALESEAKRARDIGETA